MQIQDKNVTVLKASDGINVTWHLLIDEKKADLIDSLNDKAVIEVTEATVVGGYRLEVHNFNVINDNIDEEIVLKDDLIFLDKEWYVRLFRAKDMINENGETNDTHPG